MAPITIRSESMLGTHHSWAVVMRALIEQFGKLGAEIYLNSINGYKFFPQDLQKYIRSTTRADIDLTYTLPRNFKDRFLKNSKLKLAIYNYETSILPSVWKNSIDHVDYALPSSNFSKEVFVNSGWPEEKCIVIPHGINIDDFKDKSKVGNLKTTKTFKFLNVSIPHYRKNIDRLVDAYYSAFTEDDDVCLIIKSKVAKPKYYFECNIMKQIAPIQKKHYGKKLPQIEVVQERYDSMIPLYNTCDCLVSASSSEGFGLPLLEALAADLIVVAPRCSGQLDFLNDRNSLLVDTTEVDADKKYQYWRPSAGAKTWLPRPDSLANEMMKAYKCRDSLMGLFRGEIDLTLNKFTWENAAKQILEIK
jgi:glycosyltransferase involved in cell wall biosynthesis